MQSPDPDAERLAERESLEALLDEALEESFPASDPIAVFRREEAE
jgi:hypothetical protein